MDSLIIIIIIIIIIIYYLYSAEHMWIWSNELYNKTTQNKVWKRTIKGQEYTIWLTKKKGMKTNYKRPRIYNMTN